MREPEPSGSRFRCVPDNDVQERAVDENPNPKLDPNPGSNTEKDPDDWVTGDEPMTGAQASYLTTLSEEAKEEPPRQDLTKAEASKRIDELKQRLGK
jgi:hypothetical protein